jgi:hypothetical protein
LSIPTVQSVRPRGRWQGLCRLPGVHRSSRAERARYSTVTLGPVIHPSARASRSCARRPAEGFPASMGDRVREGRDRRALSPRCQTDSRQEPGALGSQSMGPRPRGARRFWSPPSAVSSTATLDAAGSMWSVWFLARPVDLRQKMARAKPASAARRCGPLGGGGRAGARPGPLRVPSRRRRSAGTRGLQAPRVPLSRTGSEKEPPTKPEELHSEAASLAAVEATLPRGAVGKSASASRAGEVFPRDSR